MTDIAPPPDDIAGLLDWAHKATTVPPNHKDYPGQVGLIEKLAAALRSLAQEVETLKLAITNKNEACQELAQEVERLKSERDEWKQYAEVEAQVRREFKEMLDKAEAERDALAIADNHHQEVYAELAEKMAAIERKTIEECAKIADFRYFSADAAKAIRALATALAPE